jgi:hypothetical protein
VIVRNPGYIEALQEKLGLNLVVLFFAGALPDAVLAKSPFDGVPLSDACLKSLLIKHLDGEAVDPLEFDLARSCVGPTVRAEADETAVEAAIGTLRATGVEIWMCGGCYTERRLMYCPSNPAVNDWNEAVYVHSATTYDVDGLDVTHARYPMGSFPRGLFSCTCDHCRSRARELGYDMDEMIAALMAARERLRKIDGKLLTQACDLGMGFMDVAQALDLRSGVLDWFRFRADLLSDNLRRFYRAVKSAAGEEMLFGTDTHPASLSLFVGQDHAAFHEFADFASPLVSHISAFLCNTLVEWARFLTRENRQIGEAAALRIVYRFLGYDGMGLPESIGEYKIDEPQTLAYRIPVRELVMRDLVKARLCLSPELPSYPILHGEGWPREAVDGIVEESRAIGHDGIIWQGTADLVDFELK